MAEVSIVQNVTRSNGIHDLATDEGLAAMELFTDYPPALLDFAAVSCIIFMIIGIPGNLITIISLTRYKKVRNATAIFIINMSAADLLFCCINLPLAISTFWTRRWLHGVVTCQFFVFARFVLSGVAVFTVVAITINRYIMISFPRFYPRTYSSRNLCFHIAFIWIGAIGSMIPAWAGAWGRLGMNPKLSFCAILDDTTAIAAVCCTPTHCDRWKGDKEFRCAKDNYHADKIHIRVITNQLVSFKVSKWLSTCGKKGVNYATNQYHLFGGSTRDVEFGEVGPNACNELFIYDSSVTGKATVCNQLKKPSGFLCFKSSYPVDSILVTSIVDEEITFILRKWYYFCKTPNYTTYWSIMEELHTVSPRNKVTIPFGQVYLDYCGQIIISDCKKKEEPTPCHLIMKVEPIR
ncbi:7 transmembrane receptor (rhodopsin family) domain-containing protein [Phthorimaea operculella]|nr:7 transmembrane receptor (rhodopsin family) domain-containing protein [Phthorimaea operculella]